jgi:hypothetical protein
MANNTDIKDPYGREYMPIERNKNYFSPSFPFRVFLFSWMWLLHCNFYKYWVATGWPADTDDGGMFILGVIFGIVFFLISTIPIMIIGHYAFVLLGLNGYIVYAIGVLLNLFPFFTFHLYTEEGYQHWKNKLLRVGE